MCFFECLSNRLLCGIASTRVYHGCAQRAHVRKWGSARQLLSYCCFPGNLANNTKLFTFIALNSLMFGNVFLRRVWRPSMCNLYGVFAGNILRFPLYFRTVRAKAYELQCISTIALVIICFQLASVHASLDAICASISC